MPESQRQQVFVNDRMIISPRTHFFWKSSQKTVFCKCSMVMRSSFMSYRRAVPFGFAVVQEFMFLKRNVKEEIQRQFCSNHQSHSLYFVKTAFLLRNTRYVRCNYVEISSPHIHTCTNRSIYHIYNNYGSYIWCFELWCFEPQPNNTRLHVQLHPELPITWIP